MDNFETKTFSFELKDLEKDGTFTGYAAIFGKPDALGEVIEKGAFTKTLKEGKVRPMCWYHDPKIPLGIVELKQDDKGLKVLGDFDLNVQAAKEKHSLMKKKAIKGLSFGFKTIKDIWDGSTRILKEVKLFEVSPVTFQAHPDALISSVKQMFDEQKPLSNEHAAVLKPLGAFDPKTIRRKNGGTIYGKIKIPNTIAVLWAKLKEHNKSSDNPLPHSLHFPTDNWAVAQAKAWLKDNNIKYQTFEAASKSLEGSIEFLEEFKSGKVISSANLKLIDNAVKALLALLKAAEPQKSTQGGEKCLFSPIIEVLEEQRDTGKPQEHLFEGVVKTLEKSKKE